MALWPGGYSDQNDGDDIVPSCRDKGSTGAVGSATTKVVRGYAGGSSRLQGRTVVSPEIAESGALTKILAAREEREWEREAWERFDTF